MRLLLNCLLLVVLLVACQQQVEQPTFSEEKTARILADLAVADASTTLLSGYPKDSLVHVYYQQVFEMNGTSLEEYERNLRLLVVDVPRMQRIAQMAEDLLKSRKAPLDSTAVRPGTKYLDTRGAN
jgi:hypothetical protein